MITIDECVGGILTQVLRRFQVRHPVQVDQQDQRLPFHMSSTILLLLQQLLLLPYMMEQELCCMCPLHELPLSEQKKQIDRDYIRKHGFVCKK